MFNPQPMQVAKKPETGRDETRMGHAHADQSSRDTRSDVLGLLDALPMAAGVFGLKGDKVWTHAVNGKFLDMAGCDGSVESRRQLVRKTANNETNAFLRSYLREPATAPDEFDLVDGEGLNSALLHAEGRTAARGQ